MLLPMRPPSSALLLTRARKTACADTQNSPIICAFVSWALDSLTQFLCRTIAYKNRRLVTGHPSRYDLKFMSLRYSPDQVALTDSGLTFKNYLPLLKQP